LSALHFYAIFKLMFRLISLLVILSSLGMSHAQQPSQSKITRSSDGGFQLLFNGQPYFINGAGGFQNLAELAKLGGNSIRTWGLETLEQMVDGKPLLDRAHELGITVTVGIWLKHERHGFSYDDPAACKAQREVVMAGVKKYKNHPALLMWGLGNEMEGPTSDGSKVSVWKELDALARMIKAEDPNHLVMTVIAGAGPVKVGTLMKNYPSIDVLGVNAYGGASSVGNALKAAGWDKPFALTEFGPLGHWEVGKTSWGAPIEPSSRDKAATYYATQTKVLEDGKGSCIGSYVFLWGQKQEVTSTWYGMFLKSGEKLPTVDAIAKAWTGKWPENRCPKVMTFDCAFRETSVAPGTEVDASATVKEHEGDSVTYNWSVFAETKEISVGGDAEAEPPYVPDCIVMEDAGKARIRAPKKPGAYRLFLVVKDGKGGASAENMPFMVK